jgi:hypothetical protein
MEVYKPLVILFPFIDLSVYLKLDILFTDLLSPFLAVAPKYYIDICFRKTHKICLIKERQYTYMVKLRRVSCKKLLPMTNNK